MGSATPGGSDRAKVVPIGAARDRRRREPGPSDAEMAEYRRMKPALLKMLQEWEVIKTMCPIAKRLVADE